MLVTSQRCPRLLFHVIEFSIEKPFLASHIIAKDMLIFQKEKSIFFQLHIQLDSYQSVNISQMSMFH